MSIANQAFNNATIKREAGLSSFRLTINNSHLGLVLIKGLSAAWLTGGN